MSSIDERFYQLHQKSATISKKSEELFPDGVTHDSRKIAPFRVYMDHGLGPRKWDIDGNEYIDYRTGHGSMILGQAHPAIVDAVSKQVAKGTHLSSSTELEVKWGDLVTKLVPSAEKVRFVNSGTEAVMMAFRMARAYSGKTNIIKFHNAFHGWADGPFVGAKGDNEQNGITQPTRNTITVLPYDISKVETALNQDDIAAVIFQGNQVIEPTFIRQLRELTLNTNTILIFDEVVSGFRWSRGGTQELYNVTPDITTMAKILAGGLPGGCVAGRADIIDTIAPNKIMHPGTFNANPLSAAAGATALEILMNENVNETADDRASQLKDGLNELFTKLEINGTAYGVSSIIHVLFGSDVQCDLTYGPDPNIPENGHAKEVVELLHRAFINEGLWGNPLSFILSATHTKQDIEVTLEKYKKVLLNLREEVAI